MVEKGVRLASRDAKRGTRMRGPSLSKFVTSLTGVPFRSPIFQPVLGNAGFLVARHGATVGLGTRKTPHRGVDATPTENSRFQLPLFNSTPNNDTRQPLLQRWSLEGRNMKAIKSLCFIVIYTLLIGVRENQWLCQAAKQLAGQARAVWYCISGICTHVYLLRHIWWLHGTLAVKLNRVHITLFRSACPKVPSIRRLKVF